ncbi:MAG: DUF4199 domain-containing protein [Flavobacteriaceae bacterium]|nr:DUF4199 domain-containing protein [Flavobacteriaceae bacterium]
MEKTVKSIALNYGLYLGIALIVISVAIYAIDLKLMANLWLGIAMLIAIIGFGIFSTAKVKSHFEGILSFKDAFTAYFITTVVGAVISSIFSYILYTIIDPEAAEQIKQISIEATISLMEGFNAPAETIAKAVEDAEKVDQFSIGNTLKSLAFGAIFQAVIGLIVAAIMKKSNPDA